MPRLVTLVSVLFACCLLLSQSVQADIQVLDDSNQVIRLTEPARRIISLSPHLTELLFSAGAGPYLVGVVSYSNYPPAAAKLPNIGNYALLDIERITSLKPDLIVAWQSGNHPGQLDTLKKLGFPVFVNEPRSLQDIPRTIRRLGILSGTEAAADRSINEFNATYRNLQQQYQERPSVRVFYQIWDQPLMTVNGQHLISAVINLCGGQNIFAELPALAPVVNIEAVVAGQPELIVVAGSATQHRDWLDAWRQWHSLPAVRHGQLYLINPDHMQRHSVRILQGARTLCGHIEAARSKK